MFEFRRSGQRDDRRRRVLSEDATSAGVNSRKKNASTQGGDGDEPGSAYSAAAALDRQAKVTDFIPQRQRWFAAIALGGMMSVGGVVGAHFLRQQALTSDTWSAETLLALAPLELGAAGSVGSWLAAALLGVAAMLCMLLFTLRRHRRDDYRGGYRIWMSTAAMSLSASVCCVAAVHQTVAALAAQGTGWQASQAGFEWWLAPVGLLLAVQSVRLALEVRRSRIAASMLGVAVTCYLLAVLALPFGPLAVVGGSALAGGAALAASCALFIMVLGYARHVVLEIEGRLPVKVTTPVETEESKAAASSQAKKSSAKSQATTKSKRSSSDTNETDDDEDAAESESSRSKRGGSDRRAATKTKLRVAEEYDDYDEEERQPRRSRKNRTRMPKPVAKAMVNEYEDEDDFEQRDRKLSKSERKRLRRLKAQQRDAA